MYKLTQVPIPKFYNTNKAKAVVFHVDLGTYHGTVNHLKNVASASYHLYLRRYVDEVVQFVPLNKGAWHAGRKSNPNARAVKLFGSGSVNKQSVGICYEGRPVDKNGRVTSNWELAVDGEKATDRQVDLAVWTLNEFGIQKLPIFSHREITSYKPPCVIDFVLRVNKRLEEMAQDPNPVCTIAQFSTKELWTELIARYKR
jgi:N-acetylmuramoyl-L-alanine amidase CwlA